MTLPAGDDTIELVLTPEQLQELSDAAEAAQSAASAPVDVVMALAPVSRVVAPAPAAADFPPIRALRWHQTPIAKMAANTIAFVAFAWWSVAQLASEPQSHPRTPAMAAARAAVLVGPSAAATDLPKPAVQVVNPFDSTEVFEFPAGTSADESREKVAQILLQRARERYGRGEHVKSEVSLRTASLGTPRKSI